MAKPKNFLGIDLAGSGIKVVEFTNDNGRARLRTYGFTAMKEEGSVLANLDEAKKMLTDIFKEAKVSGGNVHTALPTQSVFSSILTIPKMKTEERLKAIEMQIQKLISMPITDLEVEFKELESVDSSERVFFTAASKKVVETYENFFKMNNLVLHHLETESLAMVRALIGKDPGDNILIDFGHTRTNIIMVEKGIPMISRSIKTGAADLTKLLAQNLGVDEAAAEVMKENLKTMPAIFKDFFNTVTTEVRYLINEWAGQNSTPRNVDKVILTGGGSRLPGLTVTLSDMLKLRVYLGDPWARVLYPQEIRPLLDQVGPRLTVAIGLALRGVEGL